MIPVGAGVVPTGGGVDMSTEDHSNVGIYFQKLIPDLLRCQVAITDAARDGAARREVIVRDINHVVVGVGCDHRPEPVNRSLPRIGFGDDHQPVEPTGGKSVKGILAFAAFVHALTGGESLWREKSIHDAGIAQIVMDVARRRAAAAMAGGAVSVLTPCCLVVVIAVRVGVGDSGGVEQVITGGRVDVHIMRRCAERSIPVDQVAHVSDELDVLGGLVVDDPLHLGGEHRWLGLGGFALRVWQHDDREFFGA